MGEGESFSVGWRIQSLWKLREAGLAVPSPVGRERVRVRVVLSEIRLLSDTCFCTNPRGSSGEPAGWGFLVWHRATSTVVSTARNPFLPSPSATPTRRDKRTDFPRSYASFC